MPELLNRLLIKDKLEALIDYEISDETIINLDHFFNLLLEWNKKTNLTRIVEPSDASVKHFVDSLLCLRYMDKSKPLTLLDVGTGPGFPGIPLKIACPQIDLHLLEGNNKKREFLNYVSEELRLGVSIIGHRAEDYAKAARERYHYVTSRALGHPCLSLELCSAFVKLDGFYIQLLGPSAKESFSRLMSLGQALGLTMVSTAEYNLGKEYGDRVIVTYRKDNKTPIKYPRSFSILKKLYQ